MTRSKLSLTIVFLCFGLTTQQFMYPYGGMAGYGPSGMYGAGGYGGYDPYGMMGYAGYGGLMPYGGYGGAGMMPGYGGMPYMNYGNTFGGFGSPGLSYGKALMSGKRYSSGSRSGFRAQADAEPPIGNCFGRPGCITK